MPLSWLDSPRFFMQIHVVDSIAGLLEVRFVTIFIHTTTDTTTTTTTTTATTTTATATTTASTTACWWCTESLLNSSAAHIV